jgi:hypothetical protein
MRIDGERIFPRRESITEVTNDFVAREGEDGAGIQSYDVD